MKMYYIYLFCLLFGLSVADDGTTNSITTISHETSTMVTVSTIKPSTTPESHSTNTKVPTTITPFSTKPTITASIPSSSTTASTTQASSTISPTTPAPTSEVWTVTDSSDNITCIVAKMDIVLNITSGNENHTFEGNPKITRAAGDCGDSVQYLELFLLGENNNSASLKISFNGTEKNYFISELLIKVFINSSAPATATTDDLNRYETSKNTSYSCPSYKTIKVLSNNTTVQLSLNNIQFEAFRSIRNSTEFSSANHCTGGEVPDIVPLIVGLALAGLVVVVVIGYFIGRRRSQARGYLSM